MFRPQGLGPVSGLGPHARTQSSTVGAGREPSGRWLDAPLHAPHLLAELQPHAEPAQVSRHLCHCPSPSHWAPASWPPLRWAHLGPSSRWGLLVQPADMAAVLRALSVHPTPSLLFSVPFLHPPTNPTTSPASSSCLPYTASGLQPWLFPLPECCSLQHLLFQVSAQIPLLMEALPRFLISTAHSPSASLLSHPALNTALLLPRTWSAF